MKMLVFAVLTMSILTSAEAAFAGANPIEISCDDGHGIVLSGTIPHNDGEASFSVRDSLAQPATTYTEVTATFKRLGSVENQDLSFSINVQGTELPYLLMRTFSDFSEVVHEDQFSLETKFFASFADVGNIKRPVICHAKYSK